MSAAGRDDGSVLIDALTAIGIMTLALAIGAQVIAQGARRTHASEQSRLATLEARSRLAEVGADIALVPGRVSGQDGDLVWNVDIEPDGGGAGLLKVHVVVGAPGHAALASLDSLRLAEP